MATYGKIGDPVSNGPSIDGPSIERLEQYFLANDVEDAAKQQAILLSICGIKTYALLRDLLQPAKPAETTFKKIVETLEKHFSSKPSEIVECSKFHSRNRNEGEGVAVYVEELRHLSKVCYSKKNYKKTPSKGTDSGTRKTKPSQDSEQTKGNQKQSTYLVDEVSGEEDVYAATMYHIWDGRKPKAFELQKILDAHKNVFGEGLGTLKGTEAKIYVDPEATPKFMKSRPAPYALKAKVEQELDRLQSEGIISPVEFTEWAASIVPVVKQDGPVRICGDYKCTINQVSKLDNYPISKTEDLLATLGGGNKFTKLDMSQAYQQLLLVEESRKFTTINTHKRLYQYNRLPFGVSSAPRIVQHTMENLLQGILHVVV
ncbi:hypothetical protein ACROYT_G001414 [Oculina patagonica]